MNVAHVLEPRAVTELVQQQVATADAGAEPRLEVAQQARGVDYDEASGDRAGIGRGSPVRGAPRGGAGAALCGGCPGQVVVRLGRCGVGDDQLGRLLGRAAEAGDLSGRPPVGVHETGLGCQDPDRSLRLGQDDVAGRARDSGQVDLVGDDLAWVPPLQGRRAAAQGHVAR